MAEFQFERRLDARLILSILATGIMTFGGILEETAMNITFPTLMEEFSITLSYAQWITSGYLLALIVMMPTSAFLKKKIKMKTLFMITCAAFLAGTVLCFAAPAFIWIIIGRAIQGAAAGVAVPLMFNIVLEQTPLEHIGFIVGFATMTNAMAPACGPVYGGIVLQLSNWRMIFGCLIPVMGLALILGAFSIRQSSVLEKEAVFDNTGFLFYAITLSCLVFGLNLPNVFGWGSPVVICLLIGVAAFLILFLRREKHVALPLINLKIFRYRNFSLGVAAIYCCCTICPTLSFILPNVLQLSRGLNALNAAMVLFFGCITGALVTVWAGHMYDKKGPAFCLTLGGICAIAGVVLIRFSLASWPSAVISAMFVIYMVGQGCCVSNNMTYGLQSLPPELGPDGNATMNLTQNLSGTIGIVITSGIISSAQIHAADIGEGTLTGAKTALLLLIGVAVLVNVFEFLVLHPKKK